MAAKFVLTTFADSRNDAALRRIRKQAERLDVFDEVRINTEQSLPWAFRWRHRAVLKKGVRGFGYWVWKPEVATLAARGLNRGDVVIYVDAGCHLNVGGKSRLLEYFSFARSSASGAVLFSAKPPDPPITTDGRILPEYLDAHWTKGDVLRRYGCHNRPDITQSPTIGAGVFLFRIGSDGEELIQVWRREISGDVSLIDDSPSLTPNLEGFREHRHDQAVFSLLAKLRDLPTRSAFEYWYPMADGVTADWDALREFPIHARRDIGSRKAWRKSAMR